MWNNIGEKLKGLARVIFALGTIATIIAGIVVLNLDEEELLGTGLMLLFLGPISSCIFSWLLYGFGELIQSTKNTEFAILSLAVDIKRNLKKDSLKPEIQSKTDSKL